MVTKTQEAAYMSYKSPMPTSDVWFTDPPGEAQDKKTPRRERLCIGDYFVLVEKVKYLAFPSPEMVAAAKAAGKRRPPPIPVEQYRMHWLHSVRMSVRTLKVYKHQRSYYYGDSVDLMIESAAKHLPRKDGDAGRHIMVCLLMGLMKVAYDEASSQLASWTDGH